MNLYVCCLCYKVSAWSTVLDKFEQVVVNGRVLSFDDIVYEETQLEDSWRFRPRLIFMRVLILLCFSLLFLSSDVFSSPHTITTPHH
jgi:hypothetical protein